VRPLFPRCRAGAANLPDRPGRLRRWINACICFD